MTDKQFDDAFTAAGAWFVGLYSEVVLANIEKLNDDREFKKQFIQSIYSKGNGPDKNETGTNVRVNSLMRIINSRRIIEALEKIIDSSRVKKDFPEAVIEANKLLEKLCTN
ncbi:MAG TPA: hypothetical protein VIO64_01740 [Pseudobacteroides sp.]|uniref:hypothetical protein n=1 Tax=Pseudobacteroides sp. TaxID=1968840 RepID=UPI002F94A9A7